MKRVAVASALLLLLSGAAAAKDEAVQLPRTIVDRNGDNRLEYGPRETPIVRSELAQPGTVLAPSTRLIHFAQMTDTQLVDEESPLRVEFVDRIGPPYEAAYRPQEGLLPMVLAEEVRAVRAQGPELVIVTGDNADNTQRNETRWFIDILDGGVVTADSGAPRRCVRSRLRYHGVRESRRYYEPERSNGREGPGYSPLMRANRRTAHRSNALRDYPGLLEDMNRPFRSPGLGVPWYAVIGNHDALIQGNVSGNSFFSQVAAGCTKVTDLSRRAWTAIEPLAKDGVTEEENTLIVQTIYGDVLATLSSPKKYRGLWRRVAGDVRRTPLQKGTFIGEHFQTRGSPRGHGFRESSNEGNYSFSPKPGLRFVVLDSVAAAGPDGNLDHAQFLWLHEQLLSAEAARELVFVFAHHALPSIRQRESGAHYGLTGSCPSTLATTPPTADETVLCLFSRHRSVIGFVAGHSHRNRITPYARTGGGGFWEIVTSSHTDWPQQSRIIDLFDLRDDRRTLVINTYVIEHRAPPKPAVRRREPGRLLTQSEVSRLASIARELAFNDPQAENGEDGSPDRRGSRLDRNAALYVLNPY